MKQVQIVSVSVLSVSKNVFSDEIKTILYKFNSIDRINYNNARKPKKKPHWPKNSNSRKAS